MKVRVKDDALDINDEPHPMRGLTGTVIETFGMTYAGFDCAVAFDCDHAEAATRLSMTSEAWAEMVRLNPELDHDGQPVFEDTLAELEVVEP